MRRANAAALALMAAASMSVAGCVPALLAGGVVGYGVAQERTTRDILSDNDIGIVISTELLAASPSLFHRVSVNVNEGQVVLTGGVTNPEDIHRASQIAWSVPGVVSVSNELVPDQRASASRFASDLWITSQLRARLIRDMDIRSINYTIDTHDSVVHLTGVARTQSELQAVTAHAAQVPGVREVFSHVRTINDPARLTPSQRRQPRSPNDAVTAAAPASSL